MGKLYYSGDGVEQDNEKAVEYFKIAADSGDASAMVRLGICYLKGRGTAQNKEAAVELYKKAADNNDIEGIRRLGICYDNGDGIEQNKETAVELIKKAAEGGDAPAMAMLGIFYLKGEAIEKDLKASAEWFEKSLAHGYNNFEIMNLLAWHYLNGMGVEKDLGRAIELYTKVAEANGKDSAMNTLGHIYSGENGKKDYDKAFYWFNKSADNGNANSIANLGWCYQFGYGTNKDLKKAIALYEKSNSEYSQGRIKQIKESDEWKQIAAKDAESSIDTTDPQAMCQLAMWYQYGENELPKNRDRAIYWYQKSAMAGNTPALSFMNMLLSEKDSEAADKRQKEENDRMAEMQRQLEEERNQRQAAERRAEEDRQAAERKERERKEREAKGIFDLDGFEFLGNYMTYTIDGAFADYYITYYDGLSFDEKPHHNEKSEYYERWVQNCEFAVYMKVVGGTTIYRAKAPNGGAIYPIARGNFRSVVGCTAHCRKETLTWEEYSRDSYDVVKEYEYEDFNSKFTNKQGVELRLNI